jgi:thioredoxin reductase (NADPH)
MYDIIIIGAGPAGISAGIYAKRAGAKVLILYYGETNLDKAEKIDNYYGFIDGISGKELYENGIKQAKKLEIELVNDEVINIEKNEQFIVKTSQNEYNSKSVIIATGNKKLRPNIKGIREFEGKGVSYCAICDGFFFRNKNVVVIGNGKYAENEANDLKKIAKNVTILTNAENSNIDFDFKVNEKKIKQIKGNERVEQIEFEDGSIIEVEGVFIALGEASGVDFARKIGLALNGDSIIVNEKMQTNLEGLYACGNVTGGLLQICKSVYEGAVAGLEAAKWIKTL